MSEASEPEAAPQAEPSEPEPEFELRWTGEGGGWTKGVAIAPAGWVVSASGSKLIVHASDDGRVLESARTCYLARNGLTVVSDTKGAVVCDNGELRAVTFPGLAQEVVGSAGGRVERAGWSDALVATGDRDGNVTVFDTSTWEQVDKFKPEGEIEGLAISADRRYVAVGVGRTGLQLRDLQKQSTKKLAAGDYRANAVAFSADGRQLFSKGDSFTAQVVEVDAGKLVDSHPTGSWLTGAQWLNERLVAAAGSDGFVIYASGAEPKKLVDPALKEHRAFEALDASSDGQIVCGGDRGGHVSCFSTKPMQASTYTPAPKVAATATRPSGPSADAPAAKPSLLLEGTIVSRKKKIISVTASSPTPPAVGTKGELTRHFERKLGALQMSGWMEIADVEVTAVKGNTVKLKILKETSDIKINGRKQNQFRKGFLVRLETPSD